MKLQISLKPIGYVRTERSDSEVSQSWPKGVPGRITLFPEYSAGLRGLEGFSHLIIVAWLHKVSEENRNVLKVRFRRFTRLGMRLEDLPEVGVFASDSPHRPNPIAISIVKVRKIDGDSVYVEGLDLYDGTPILDLRAYTPSYSIPGFTTPSWYQRLTEKLRSARG